MSKEMRIQLTIDHTIYTITGLYYPGKCADDKTAHDLNALLAVICRDYKIELQEGWHVISGVPHSLTVSIYPNFPLRDDNFPKLFASILSNIREMISSQLALDPPSKNSTWIDLDSLNITTCAEPSFAKPSRASVVSDLMDEQRHVANVEETTRAIEEGVNLGGEYVAWPMK
ncbi:MAG: hypothetical protein V4485_00730 [Pseudomonadota bacterium]